MSSQQIRGDAQAQALAAYLYSNHHSNMIGLYYLPLGYASHDLGWDVTRAMSVLVEQGFCEYDYNNSVVFVCDMARQQTGDFLKTQDKRHAAVIKILKEHEDTPLVESFIVKYGNSYNIEAPSKPGNSDQGSESYFTHSPAHARVIDIDIERVDRLADDKAYTLDELEASLPRRWASTATLPSGRQQEWRTLDGILGAEIKQAVHTTLEGASRPCLAYFVVVAQGIIRKRGREAPAKPRGYAVNDPTVGYMPPSDFSNVTPGYITSWD